MIVSSILGSQVPKVLDLLPCILVLKYFSSLKILIDRLVEFISMRRESNFFSTTALLICTSIVVKDAECLESSL